MSDWLGLSNPWRSDDTLSRIFFIHRDKTKNWNSEIFRDDPVNLFGYLPDENCSNLKIRAQN